MSLFEDQAPWITQWFKEVNITAQAPAIQSHSRLAEQGYSFIRDHPLYMEQYNSLLKHRGTHQMQISFSLI